MSQEDDFFADAQQVSADSYKSTTSQMDRIRNYRRQTELAALNNYDNDSTDVLVDSEEPAKEIVETPTRPKTIQSSAAPHPGQDNITIVLKNKKSNVSISFTDENSSSEYGSAGNTFRVSFVAANVSITDNCVAVLVDNTLNIEPPILKKLMIKAKGESFPVHYVGGTHELGNYRQLSFIRVSK
jgi:hypothetical protein